VPLTGLNFESAPLFFCLFGDALSLKRRGEKEQQMNKIKLIAVLAVTILAVVSGCGKESDKSRIEKARREAENFAMSGRRLAQSIIVANVDRQIKGKPSLWPHNDENDGKSADTEDIAGMSFNSSTAYFKELFDVQNQQDADNWAPYIEGCEVSWLSGGGVPLAKSGRLAPENVGWIVASGITEDMSDYMPVLISANVNTDMLITSGKAATASDNRRIPIGTANGASKDIFANQFVVVITKFGGAYVIDRNDFTMRNLYNNRYIVIPDGITLRYLKP